MSDQHPSPYDHVILSQQFDFQFLDALFARTDAIIENPTAFSRVLSGKVIASLFYEPSTRTRLSFESAVQRLGGACITTENAKEFSSAVKGETLEDTIRIVDGYADAIILRHFEDDASLRAVRVSAVPIINAGSGKSQHPTQALLDVYTIWKKFGTLEGLTVAVAGDLLRGRTADSLVYLLSKFKGIHLHFISPAGCEAKQDLKEYLTRHAVPYEEHTSLAEVLPLLDVLYMTRLQKERFSDEHEYFRAEKKYALTPGEVAHMKESAIIMHPLPRNSELPDSIDSDPRAYYFKQAQNGLYVRMAILSLLKHV